MVQEDKKERILNASLKLFVEKGIDNASTSLISKESGVATGTLYLYFENKVDLINKLYISIKEEYMVIMLSNLTKPLSYESLKNLWMKTIDWGVKNPYKFKFMMQFDPSPYKTEDVEAKFAHIQKDVIRLIEEGIKNKLLKDLPPAYILELILTHISYTMEYILRTKTNERIIFFKTLLDGIKQC